MPFALAEPGRARTLRVVRGLWRGVRRRKRAMTQILVRRPARRGRRGRRPARPRVPARGRARRRRPDLAPDSLAEGVHALADKPSLRAARPRAARRRGAVRAHTVVAEVTTTPGHRAHRSPRPGGGRGGGRRRAGLPDQGRARRRELLDRSIRYAVERAADGGAPRSSCARSGCGGRERPAGAGSAAQAAARTDTVSCATHYRPGRQRRARRRLLRRRRDARRPGARRHRRRHGSRSRRGRARGPPSRRRRPLRARRLPDDQILRHALAGCSRPSARTSLRHPLRRHLDRTPAVASGSPATRRRSARRRGGELPRRPPSGRRSGIRDDQG